MTSTAPIPAPPADRVPTRRDADCHYCDRYDRPCGRHELAIDVREPATENPVGSVSARAGQFGPEICYAVGSEYGCWYVVPAPALFTAAGVEPSRIYVEGGRRDAENLVRLFAALYEKLRT